MWRSLELTKPRNGIEETRDYLDFVIDGESLNDLLRIGSAKVGCLGGTFPNAFMEAMYFKALLLEHQSYLETGRYELYVCSLCGDIGCGSITVDIQAVEGRVVWRNFAYEVNYWFDDPSEIFQERYDIEPFEFDRVQYRQALLAWPVGRPHRMKPRLEGLF